MQRNNRLQVSTELYLILSHLLLSGRTGKFVGYQVPGAGVIMMILENVIPQSIRSWFNVVKTAVMDTNNNCDVEYLCTLVDDQ